MLTNDVQPYRRYRITSLCDVEATDDAVIELGAAEWIEPGRRFKAPKRIIPAGTVYEGIASDVDDNGFFDRHRDPAPAENPHFDLSDIDDAFESLENLRLGKRSTIGQMQRR